MKSLLHLQSTTSTNQDAFQLALAGKADHGFGVVADSQSEGRGRLGRVWSSPANTGLYCSIVLRPKLPLHQFPQITLTAGLSLCQMVESLDIHGFGLKWPNDLYCQGKKCGGILVETSPLVANSESVFAVVGTGLNVNSDESAFPEELSHTATSLYLETGTKWSVMSLYKKFRSLLLQNLKIHQDVGFHAILEEWRERDVLLGKEMKWVTRDKKLIIGKGLGPDADGQLLAEDSAGNIHEILSGDVSLVLKNK